MILDSSAVVAIFFQEPTYDQLLTKLATAEQVGIGAPTLVECSIVLTAKMNLDARGLEPRFMSETHVNVIPSQTYILDSRWRLGLSMAKDAIRLP